MLLNLILKLMNLSVNYEHSKIVVFYMVITRLKMKIP